jgi:sulfur-oxidizing protein SoxB
VHAVLKRLTVVQLNDSHGYLEQHQELFWGPTGALYRPAGGMARIATLLKELRASLPGQVLFCDGGDTFHGTYPVVASEGQVVVPILQALAPAATTAHWEFAYGPPRLQALATALPYPLLACNVYDQVSGNRPFPSHTVIELADLRVGIVGIASNIVDKTMPPSFSAGLRFTLGRDELPGLIELLRREERVDLVLLLSHLGFPQDMRLIAEVPGVDVCLSAHTHNRLFAPVRQGETVVIQSGCHGSFLGSLELEVDGGRVVDYRHQLREVDAGIAPDPAVAALVRAALAPYQEELAEVVGQTATALTRATTLEATMDNFLLQAIQELTGADLAFSNGWRYGAPIVPGPITRNDLYNIIPMNPPVSMVELTGAEVYAMLEENLERTFSVDPYRQMGGYLKRCLGLRAYVKLENPAGQRLQHLFIGGRLVQPERRYTAAFITEQGVGQAYGHNRRRLPERAMDALEGYCRRHRPVRADVLGTFVAV